MEKMETGLTESGTYAARTLEQKYRDAIWIGASLFQRGKTAGSSANMSFRDGDRIYITCSGTCFGALTKDSFAATDLEGNCLDGRKPSKELPLHLSMYTRPGSRVQAVIHVHSFYAALWSCLAHEGFEDDVIPHYTPYLGMKLGKIRLVPYAKPGSAALFAAYRKRLSAENGYLLAHHGPVVGGEDLMEAFYALEELEESAHLAWELRKSGEAVPEITD